MLLLLFNQPAATGVNGTATTSQGQSVSATASTTVTGTASTSQGQSVSATGAQSIIGTSTTSQAQRVNATTAQSVSATGTTAQGQSVTATAATGAVVTGTATTGQGQSVAGTGDVTAAQPDKRGGDDVPREEHWERRKPDPSRDATLDAVIQQAYDKAIGREVAKLVQVVDAFDYESDDEDVLMLMMG